jgi:predicted AlkP superfamily phosphohydrolase/phosphomutase
MPKVLLIALDGATFDVINPLVDAGRLPALARLLRAGAAGPLMSTYPAITPPAFASILTGCNPGKHGVYDFFSRLPDSYEFQPSSGGMMKAEPIHRIADRHGIPSVVVNTPMTYPPATLQRGAVVAGLETPPRAPYTYPRALQHDLERRFDYRIELDRWYRRGEEDAEMAAIESLADTHRRAALSLMRELPWQLFVVTLRAPDHAQHYFWRFYDAAAPGDDATSNSRYADFIPRAYEACDRAIADLVAAAGDDTAVIIVSDHGFGRETKMVHLSNWLEQSGFLRFRGGAAGKLKQAAFRAGFTVDNVMNMLSRLHLERLFTGTSRATKASVFRRFFLSYDDIDWAHTRAYARGQIGQIFLNVRGREPHGIVNPGADYERTRDDIVHALAQLRDPDTGARIVDRCHLREDLYGGPHTASAPDIVIDWKDMEYWSYDVITGGRKIVSPNLETRSGGHRMNGIFVAAGPGVRQGAAVEANVVDVAPTVLRLLGLPSQLNMDGRALDEVLLDTSPRQPAEAAGAVPQGDGAYTDEEEEAVRERLRQLGYL